MRETALSTVESSFALSALAQGRRLDGRTLTDTRTVSLSFGAELGSVTCSMGKTRVMAQVSAEVVRPPPERPYEGFLVISTEVTPLASAAYEMNRQTEEEILVARTLEKAIRRTEAVDRESLCIVAGDKVWSIRVDVHFLNDDGNLADCACLAAMAALLHFRRPDVTVENGADVTIHSLEERVPVPLAIHHTPLCVTFAFFENQASPSDSIVAIDPTGLETQISSGEITYTLNAQSEICVLSKAGGTPLAGREIMRMMGLALVKVKELDELIDAALLRDSRTRVVSII
ncbi:uncharacterized protein L969DRAFT_26801 [Mixia osmundae IAM 14324]|uniref:Exosome complex component RRP45 n=1 Tax=Mixia osmundae (strain CBS 9802 / IAM 14324 / JCM 22182 / KY 12970) TaxID=764103 RepID=G7E4F1_MIXOS|nr:uncharacterized protein L969DRAFT_26801 [Mixia osmundae IAM 14324]KEI36271.1 hypothetical protein L969DRAFT_26801 [Mixia osmundae IAM 14324]GAA97711.1 hypothetical protein E5Q_04390 [Mixia osmundae IAM 14324]